MRTSQTIIPLVVFARLGAAQNYNLNSTFIGHDFLNGGWTWETFDDPTHGRVNFVDQQTAVAQNLSFATDTKFVMSADSTKPVSAPVRGRDSIRIESKASFDDAILVLDLQHMPEGCATWPAFWTLSDKGPWPNGGEIDVIEGVHNAQQNLASLHTTPDCEMSSAHSQTGFSVSKDCNTAVNYNQGCGASFTTPASYGSAFNAAGGGWYVLQKSPVHGIAVWFWSRADPDVPPEIRDGNPVLSQGGDGGDTDGGRRERWGVPDAAFGQRRCDYAEHFNGHRMVFDLTFCGDWAGNSFGSAGCGPGSCNDYVDNNPGAFVNAYWEVNSLRVYTGQS